MPPPVSRNDLTAVLGFLEDAGVRPQGTEPFTPHLIDRLTEVLGCEYARYKEIDFARRVEIAHVPCSAELDSRGRDPVEVTDADWNAVSFRPVLPGDVLRAGRDLHRLRSCHSIDHGRRGLRGLASGIQALGPA